jgi:hypothetical protein
MPEARTPSADHPGPELGRVRPRCQLSRQPAARPGQQAVCLQVSVWSHPALVPPGRGRTVARGTAAARWWCWRPAAGVGRPQPAEPRPQPWWAWCPTGGGAPPPATPESTPGSPTSSTGSRITSRSYTSASQTATFAQDGWCDSDSPVNFPPAAPTAAPSQAALVAAAWCDFRCTNVGSLTLASVNRTYPPHRP